MELNEVNLEKLMEADVAMRDKIAELENEIKDIKTKREKIQFALNEICKEMNVSSLMEKRIAQGNMKEFLEQNPDVVPPSLQQNSEFSIVIRRSRENKE